MYFFFAKQAPLVGEHPPWHGSALLQLSGKPNKQGRRIRKPNKEEKQPG